MHRHAGAAASDSEKALQQSLLKRVLTDAAAEVSPQLLVHTAAVLISAAVSDHSQYTTSPADWIQDWDDDFQQQLDDLARGEFAPSSQACQILLGSESDWPMSAIRLCELVLVLCLCLGVRVISEGHRRFGLT